MKKILLGGLLWLALLNLAQAEQMQQFGDYEVHYSLVNTRQIPAQVAKVYDIVRADNRMLLNVAIRKRGDGLKTVAQQAELKGTRHDLMRTYNLKFTEIKEQGAIYYISEFKVINEEFSRFAIDIKISEDENFTLEFKHTMYVD